MTTTHQTPRPPRCRPVIIRCANCGHPTGAWFVDRHSYLPLPAIECGDCVIFADDSEADDGH